MNEGTSPDETERQEGVLLTRWAGGQFDTIPELAMHVGIWLMLFGMGLVYGDVVAVHFALELGVMTIFAAAIIGIPGQIAMERGDHE